MTGARILVVDDEPALVRLCADLLIEAGYQAHLAYSGRQALACLEQEWFDLLLLDLKMPDVDGLMVLRQAGEMQPGVVAVVMTSYVTQENALEARQAGAGNFLPKPFDPEDLLQAVGNVLAARRLPAATASPAISQPSASAGSE
jgi:DNA-binding NtrC family response regulator